MPASAPTLAFVSIDLFLLLEVVFIRLRSVGIGTQQHIKDDANTDDKHQTPQEQQEHAPQEVHVAAIGRCRFGRSQKSHRAKQNK